MGIIHSLRVLHSVIACCWHFLNVVKFFVSTETRFDATNLLLLYLKSVHSNSPFLSDALLESFVSQSPFRRNTRRLHRNRLHRNVSLGNFQLVLSRKNFAFLRVCPLVLVQICLWLRSASASVLLCRTRVCSDLQVIARGCTSNCLWQKGVLRRTAPTCRSLHEGALPTVCGKRVYSVALPFRLRVHQGALLFQL